MSILIFCALAVLLLQCPELCSSATGVSLSKKMTTEDWAALKATVSGFDFAAIHFQFFDGSINPHAPSTIQAAWNHNITDISFYIHPCMESSFYSKSSNIDCGTAQDQLQSILNSMHSYNMDFRRFASLNGQPSDANDTHAPTARPTAMPTTTGNTYKVQIQRLFVCFEDEVPNRYHSMDHMENVRFMQNMTAEANRQGIQVGVYTTKNDWMNTMTDKMDGQSVYRTSQDTHSTTNPFAHLPLWTPRFDSVNNMDFYAPFADWERVLIKQVSGSTSALHRLGSDRLAMNYLDEAAATEHYDNQILEYVVV